MMSGWSGNLLAAWAARVKLVAVMSLGILVVFASVPAVVGQESTGFATHACEAPDAAGDAGALLAPESEMAAELPPGLALAVLADEATEAWPPFARGLVMTVRHLTLDPGVVSAARQSQGPILFYVESGAVSVSINGQPELVRQGESLLVERTKHYQLRNDDPATAAMLLRVQVVPPGGETKVARGDIAMAVGDEQALAPGPPFIASRLLLSAEIPAVEGLNHVVMGCLSWMDAAADMGEAAPAGPAAFLVLEGEMLVGESGALAAGQCTVFQRGMSPRLRAGSSPPLVLTIGILPDGALFWAEPVDAEPAPGRLAYSCDPVVEPDAIPDAARLFPVGSQAGTWL